jgi:outer membrane protein OmpA-like peptidoglycan-associated protein
VRLLNGINPVTTLAVAGEGTWSVDTTSGAVTFTPEAGFTGSPTVVSYRLADDQGNISNTATITVSYGFLDGVGDLLKDVLENDLGETVSKQSALFGDISRGARDRLEQQLAGAACIDNLNDFISKNPILFETDRADIDTHSYAVIEALASIIQSCPTTQIEIAGHTDPRGGDSYNMTLSQARVTAVAAALTRFGIDTDRLHPRGYGLRMPIAENSTPEGMARNRRVEFRVLDAEMVQQRCGNITPFDVNGGLQDMAGGLQTSGTFGSEHYNCATGVRYIERGDFSISNQSRFGTQAMISATAQWEKMVSPEHLRGAFIGGYFSRSVINSAADGNIDGYGAYGGLYGAASYERDFYLDYYLATSFGKHSFDLEIPEATRSISTHGSYQYYGLFGGLAISGQVERSAVLFTPRVGMHLSYASALDLDVIAEIPGRSEAARLSLADQKGTRFFGEVEISLGDYKPDDDDVIINQLDLTPRLYCDVPMGGDAEVVCGVGVGLEYRAANSARYDEWGFKLNGETNGDTRRVSMGIFSERAVLNNRGNVRLSSDVNQSGAVSLGGSLHIDF